MARVEFSMTARTALLILALAGAAAAQEKPAEKIRASVRLKDGSVVRGTLRHLRLGKSISVSLPSGKSQTIDDAEIVSIELSGGAAAPEESSAQAVKEQKPPPPLPEPTPVSQLDTVYLNDGGLLRGTVVSEKPDVVLRLVSGRERTVPAKDVKSIVRHGAPAAAEAVDAVYLKDGSVLRGTVESEKPDVVVRLVSGRKRTVPAKDVQRIDRARKP